MVTFRVAAQHQLRLSRNELFQGKLKNYHHVYCTSSFPHPTSQPLPCTMPWMMQRTRPRSHNESSFSKWHMMKLKSRRQTLVILIYTNSEILPHTLFASRKNGTARCKRPRINRTSAPASVPPGMGNGGPAVMRFLSSCVFVCVSLSVFFSPHLGHHCEHVCRKF